MYYNVEKEKIETRAGNIMDKWEQQLKEQRPGQKRRPKIYISITAAFITLVLTFGLSIFSPTFAATLKNLPVIGSAFEFVSNISVKTGKEQGLTIPIEKQVEIDGQLITFTDTLYDGGEIHIGYLIEASGMEQTSLFAQRIRFLIDGQPMGGGGMGISGVWIENGLFAGTISLRVRDKIPDSFLLGICSLEDNSLLVELPVAKLGESKVTIVNQKKEFEDLALLYEKISFLPTSTELSISLIMPQEAFNQRKYMHLDYQIIDELGRVLQPLSGSGGGGGPISGIITQKFKYYFEPLESLPKTITIKPYLRDYTNTTVEIVRENWEQEKLTLSQGDIGQVMILDIQKENGIITLTYEVEGQNAYQQANALWIENGKGKRYDSRQPAERVSGKINQYQLAFPSSADTADLYVATIEMNSLQYLEDLEITLEIDR